MLPEAFLERMQKMLGQDYSDFLYSLEQEKYQALRQNPLKKADCDSAQRTADSILYTLFNVTQVSWEQNGYYYTKDDQPGKNPLHEAGVYYIQEPSAMAVVPLLDVQPGEKVLDLCAAPGGKSTQIAGYLQGKGLLISNEIHPTRSKILSENIERLGVRNACVTNESPTRMAERFPQYFDKILVDAPCSGEGMFRKNETAGEEWSPENVEMCAQRQDEILDCAAQMLRLGGRLVYSTCTFAPEENEGSVSRFLNRHPEFSLIPIPKRAMGLPEGLCDGRPEWAGFACRENLRFTLRLWPHVVKGEGHFAAILQKEGSVPESFMRTAQGGMEKGLSGKEKELDSWWDFWRETCSGSQGAGERVTYSTNGKEICSAREDQWEIAEKHIFLRFGENLYLAPRDMPALKGMKVLRPGLHLGTFCKNRFEPSHALALALTPEDVRHVCHFELDDERVSEYLSGQTFSYDGEKGWYLITVAGYSLGWGKLAGGIMKNHYPKGLRKK